MFTVVIPTFVVNIEYKVIYDASGIKLSAIGYIVLIVGLWYFKDHFSTYVKLLQSSGFKTALTAILNSFPAAFISLILFYLKDTALDASLIAGLVAISWLIAGVFKALHLEIVEPLLIQKGLNKR
jgi:hypothetical protein